MVFGSWLKQIYFVEQIHGVYRIRSACRARIASRIATRSSKKKRLVFTTVLEIGKHVGQATVRDDTGLAAP